MIKKAFFVLISFLFFACSGEQKEIPDSVLSKEKMAEVMVDIHLVEAALNLNAGKQEVREKLNFDIYKKHNITKEEYQKSYVYYTENPEALTEVYDIVLKELSKLQASATQAN